jgi:hypothetical protein
MQAIQIEAFSNPTEVVKAVDVADPQRQQPGLVVLISRRRGIVDAVSNTPARSH